MPYIGRGSDGFGIRERYQYTATSGQTAFTGSDINSKTLKFDNGSLIDVYLNGVLLKPTTDYNTSTANTVTLVSGASTSDEVMIIVYDVFALSDAMPKTGGTFSGALVAEGGVTFNEGSNDVDFRVESNGDANMLFVEGGTNMIGIKTNDPKEVMDVRGALVASGDHATNSNAQGSAHGVMLSSTSGTGYVSPISNSTNDVDLTLRALNGGSFENRLVLDSEGDVTVSTGDIIFSAAGKGINLGVTSNTDSNTLEDYEEGTWAATTNANLGLTSGSNTGSYTKIGDICHARLYMRVASVSGTNHIYFSLPFTAAANTATDSYNAEAVGHIAQWQCSFGTGHIFCKVGNGSSTLYTYTSGNDADWAIITNSSIDTASQMAINITYRTA